VKGGTRVWPHIVGALVVLTALAVALAAMGRVWWCRAGDTAVWSADVVSRHNSQHLADPYTFTHVLHGLMFYAGVWAIFQRLAGPIGRAWIAFSMEAAWEVVENTDAVIERYRAATISLDYYGDSIANSISDILAFVVGYWAAGMLPVAVSVVGFFLVEGLLILWIRDSLLLNVLMLVRPIEAVREFQMRGRG